MVHEACTFCFLFVYRTNIVCLFFCGGGVHRLFRLSEIAQADAVCDEEERRSRLSCISTGTVESPAPEAGIYIKRSDYFLSRLFYFVLPVFTCQ